MPRKKRQDGQLNIDFDAAERAAASLPPRLTKANRQDLIRFAGIRNVPFMEGKKRRQARGDDIKHLLRIIDDRNQVYGIEWIMEDASWSCSKAWRVVRGAVQLSLIAIEKVGRVDVFRIVHTELKLLVPGEKLRLMKLFQEPAMRSHSTQKAPPLDHEPVPTESATRSHSTPNAPPRGGANRPEPLQKPSKAPSDVRVDGALDGEVRVHFDKLSKFVDCARDDNRNLVTKISILWANRDLPEDLCEQVLESFTQKDYRAEPIRNPAGFLFQAFTNQCQERGFSFSRLLAQTNINSHLGADA